MLGEFFIGMGRQDSLECIDGNLATIILFRLNSILVVLINYFEDVVSD
jgi:hypothetical protein